MGLGNTWIRWIMCCVTSASISVLVNGSPLDPSPMERGLRQGNPLSPYLFVIAIEGLVQLFKNAERFSFI